MEWYNYIACFFAGAFLSNAVPHFVHGVSGNKFPSPFAKPPGRGLSSPVVNVLWGVFNIIVGYLLFGAGKISCHDRVTVVLFIVGVTAMGVMSANNFQKKDKE